MARINHRIGIEKKPHCLVFSDTTWKRAEEIGRSEETPSFSEVFSRAVNEKAERLENK